MAQAVLRGLQSLTIQARLRPRRLDSLVTIANYNRFLSLVLSFDYFASNLSLFCVAVILKPNPSLVLGPEFYAVDEHLNHNARARSLTNTYPSVPYDRPEKQLYFKLATG